MDSEKWDKLIHLDGFIVVTLLKSSDDISSYMIKYLLENLLGVRLLALSL